MKITQAERKTWSPKARQFVAELEDTFELTPGEVVTLIETARGITRLDAIHAALQGGELTVQDRFGAQVSHPLVVEARLTSAVVAKLIGSLRVPEIEADEATGAATTKKGTKTPRRVGIRAGMYAPGLSVVPGGQ